jgi:DnaJ-class molecular chaperone
MGQISMKISALPGSVLSENQHITLYEAVLGARIEVPTIDGAVTMSVPKGANTGTRLRLKGKGVPGSRHPAGDLYVTLKVVLPERPDPTLEHFVSEWAATHPYEVRRREGVG